MIFAFDCHHRSLGSPRRSRRTLSPLVLVLAAGAGLAASACSSTGSDTSSDAARPAGGTGGGVSGATGGATGTGGASVTGGATGLSTGGSGLTASGGAVAATGGQTGSGGAPQGGGTGGGNSSGSGGTAGARGGSGGAGGGTAGAGGVSVSDPNKRHLLMRDEAQSMVSYAELGNPAAGWHVKAAYGRDMQLVGSGLFMIGTDNGYEERMISTGALVTQRTTFPGTLSAHRIRNGNTILAGVNWQGGTGIVLVEVNSAGVVQRKITYSEFNYVRLVRQTPAGTFLVTADTLVFEGDATGKVLWRAPIAGPAAAHVWQALRIPSGETVVSTGYGASIVILGTDGSLHKTITGPASVMPNQFVGFQILPTGNFIVANWQGHLGEVMGVQLLEYNPQGTLVWSYRPNTTTESLSLHHVIVLDGLDLTKLHVDDTTGVLVPVP